jgi:hypothetical protein
VLALGVLAAALVASLGLSPARGEVLTRTGHAAARPVDPVASDQSAPAQTGREHPVRAPETAAAVAYGAMTSTPPVNVPCTTPGTTGNRIQAVYAYFGTAGNRVATSRPYIVDALKRANGIVYYSARQTGGTRHLRLATDSACQPSVLAVNLPATAASSFTATVSAMQSKGYTHPQRKYLLFADARAICGLGQTYLDDQASGQNRNNRGPQFARVDLGCWSGSAVVHEVFHTLGAVQKTAPHSDTALHCRDERDVMCYSGAGGTSVYMTSLCYSSINDERLDCAKNDYFHTAPAVGSYLATRWNTARSSFLWGGGPAYQFPPNGVRSLTATTTTATATSVRLAWAAPTVSTTHSAAYAYRILRGTSPLAMKAVTTTRYLSFTDAAPLIGSSTYWVIGYNAGGDGGRVGLSITR